jgi:SNF2 family DNA or RNA helicase
VIGGNTIRTQAHQIRNAKAKQTLAAFALVKPTRRIPVWMVTGTPIQNNPKDLFPLVKMIGVQALTDFAWYNRLVVKPLGRTQGEHGEGTINLRTLMGCLTLRRTKGMQVKDQATGEMRPLVSLPSKTVRVSRITLSAEARDMYDKLFAQSQRHARVLLKGRSDYMGILTLLSRIRQLCCDPRLLPEDVVAALGRDEDIVAKALSDAKMALGKEAVMAILQKLRLMVSVVALVHGCREPVVEIRSRSRGCSLSLLLWDFAEMCTF